MLGYIVRRLLGAIPTLFIIVAATFFLMRLAPGGPFDGERRLPPEIERNIKAAYNLDKPVYEQFTIYIDKILTHGDFGPSFKNKDFTVSELIMLGAPVSLMLGLLAITLAVFVGSTLGVTAALRQNTSTDYSVMSLAMIGITIPTFVTAPFLTLILGVYMGGIKEIPDTIFGQGALVGFLVPYVVDMLPLPVAGYGEGAVRNLILPVIVLALPQIAIISRLVRGSMVEVLKSNFVRTAKAKGLTDGQVVWRHAMRAGLLPLVSYLGPAIAGLVTGSLVVEQIFGLPGIGRYFVQGALNRDYTLVMGVVILFATLIITLNLIADIMYRVLDPRVKMDQPFPWVMVGIAAALALLWFTPPGQFVWNQIAGFFTSETVGGALLWAWNALWTGLLWLLYRLAEGAGYSHLLASGVRRQLGMYRKMGFEAIGPERQSGNAFFTPLAMALDDLPGPMRRIAARFEHHAEPDGKNPPPAAPSDRLISLLPGPPELWPEVQYALTPARSRTGIRPASPASNAAATCSSR